MPGARNLLAQNQQVQNAQGASLYVLGWLAQILAFLGGSYAKNTWPGDIIRWLFGLVPWDDFTKAVLIIWFAGWAVDILWDLTPNQIAITFGFVAPILSHDQNGTLADRIDEWSSALRSGLGGQVETITGNLGAGTLAVICVAVAVIIGKRVLAKKSGNGGGR